MVRPVDRANGTSLQGDSHGRTKNYARMSSRFKRRSNDVLGSKYSGSGSILQLPDYLTEQAGRGCVGTSMELGRRRGVLCVLSLIYILWLTGYAGFAMMLTVNMQLLKHIYICLVYPVYARNIRFFLFITAIFYFFKI